MLDLPPTHCQAQQQIAIEIMQAVNDADLSKIKSANNKKILHKAIDNYFQDKPLSVGGFSIMIYEGCRDE